MTKTLYLRIQLNVQQNEVCMDNWLLLVQDISMEFPLTSTYLYYGITQTKLQPGSLKKLKEMNR